MNNKIDTPAKKHWLESRATLYVALFVVFFVCGLFSVGVQAYRQQEVWTRTQFLQAAFLRACVAFVGFQFVYWPLFNRFAETKKS